MSMLELMAFCHFNKLPYKFFYISWCFIREADILQKEDKAFRSLAQECIDVSPRIIAGNISKLFLIGHFLHWELTVHP